MRTTIVIDDRILEQARRLTGVSTKKDLVNLSLRELVRQKRRQRLGSKLGKMDLSLTPVELDTMRGNG